MILHSTTYKQLKALIQLEKETGKRQNITHLDMMNLAETEKMIKSSKSMQQEYLDEQPETIQHIANKQGENISPDAITKQYHDDNKRRVEQANKETITNAPGLYAAEGSYAQDGVYLKSKVLSQATGIADGTIRALASKKILEKNDKSEISVKSLSDYVAEQVNAKWAEYQKLKSAQAILNG